MKIENIEIDIQYRPDEKGTILGLRQNTYDNSELTVYVEDGEIPNNNNNMQFFRTSMEDLELILKDFKERIAKLKKEIK